MNIPLYKTHYPKDLGARLQQVFDTGMTSEGPEAAAFQKELQDWVGNPFVALTSSGTVALEIAGVLAGVKPGDEVIASPVTCVAGTEWILKAGAKPVWCDIDPNTGCIDYTKIEKLITSKTRAITFVDWAGTPAELLPIQQLANQYGLKVIEDGAQSMGALYMDYKVGNICDYTITSFQSIKFLSTGDGGCLACRNQADYDRAILLRWFGLARGQNTNAVCWTGDITEPGYKAHMNDLNAAIGREQLKHVDKLIAVHRNNAQFLQENLVEMYPNLVTPTIPDHIKSSYWVFTIRLRSKEHRAEVSKKLTEAGIGNNISHVRNDKYSLFKDYQRKLPMVDFFEDRRLNIPCGWWLTQEDLQHIVNTLRKIS